MIELCNFIGDKWDGAHPCEEMWYHLNNKKRRGVERDFEPNNKLETYCLAAGIAYVGAVTFYLFKALKS